MIFVIAYDRKTQVSAWLAEYVDGEMAQAQQRRLLAETQSTEVDDREIVVLTAPSKDVLRQTHGRYFGPQALRDELSKVVRVKHGSS